jgi:hypothetical protein
MKNRLLLGTLLFVLIRISVTAEPLPCNFNYESVTAAINNAQIDMVTKTGSVAKISSSANILG